MSTTAPSTSEALDLLAQAFAPALGAALSSKASPGAVMSVFDRLRRSGAPAEAVEAALAVIVPAMMPAYRQEWNARMGPFFHALGLYWRGQAQPPAKTPLLAEDFLGEHMGLAEGRDWEDTAVELALVHLRAAYASAIERDASLSPHYLAEWCAIGARNAYTGQLRAILERPGAADALAANVCRSDRDREQLAALQVRAGGSLTPLVDARLAERMWLGFARAHKAGVPYAAGAGVLDAFAERLVARER